MAAEKRFEDRVKSFLTEQGAWFLKYWGGGHYTKSGIPDLLVCSFGQFIGIELKADNGEPTMLQLKTLEKIRKAGGWSILLYPGDFTGFRKWYVAKIKAKAWYLENIELQEKWIQKLKERGIEEDGNKEES